jgi:hypothetical protein
MATASDSRLSPQPPSSPRGLLPTPPEVKKLVARELKNRSVADRERQRITDRFNLQYYFGGQEVAYRQTDQGVEVLAVGPDEIGELLQRVARDERPMIIIGYPEPW